LYSIDSFINTPTIISVAVGFILFFLLFVIKIRNTKKISFIFYLILGVYIIGSIYACASQHTIYLVFTLLLCEVLLLPYLILSVCSNPEKKELKAKLKLKSKTESLERQTTSISKTALDTAEEKFNRIIEVNNQFTATATKMFTAPDSMNHFLDYLNKELTEKTHADGCAILIADEFDNILAVKSMSGTFPPPYKLPEDLPHKPLRVETSFKFAQFPLSDNIFGDIATSKEPALIEKSSSDPRIYQNGPEDFLECGSYIFIPIKLQNEVIGVAAVSRNPGKDCFTAEEFETAKIITNASGSALRLLYSFLEYSEHQESTKEGDTASKFQKLLLPSKFPVISKLSIGSFSNQTENVCGDYYDVLVSRKDRISFVMIDVAGKGMNSLIIMVMIRAMLRLIINTPQSAATILSWANRGICLENTTTDHFASIALINYNSITNEAQIATCGINPVFRYSAAAGTVTRLSENSEPLGVAKETVYKDITIKLEKGDILITCTDGLLESLNEFGVQYSTTNLSKVIETNHLLSGHDIADRVKDDIKKFCGNAQQYDDQSIMVIKLQG
jgi:phosphoserine phosphatase RsbU/P